MTMTLAQLAEEVQRQQETKRDLIADTRRVSLAPRSDDDGTPVLVLDMPSGAEDFPVRRYAHQQIAEAISLPWKTYERWLGDYPDVLYDSVTRLFAAGPEKPGKPMKRMVRVLDGQVRAVLSDGYRPRDNADLLEHILPVFGEFPGVEFKRCDLTETRLYVKTYWPGTERQIDTPYAPGSKVGDTVRQGVIISNSEIGAGSLYIYPYTDVLSCRNGMVHKEFGQRSVHLGKRLGEDDGAFEFFSDDTIRKDDIAFFAKAADGLRACLNESVFDTIADQMRDLAGIRIDAKPVDAIETLSARHSFTGEESDSILQHLIEGGDLSGWGYVNALTRTARDLDADRQTELEMIAGRLTSEPDWARQMAAA